LFTTTFGTWHNHNINVLHIDKLHTITSCNIRIQVHIFIFNCVARIDDCPAFITTRSFVQKFFVTWFAEIPFCIACIDVTIRTILMTCVTLLPIPKISTFGFHHRIVHNAVIFVTHTHCETYNFEMQINSILGTGTGPLQLQPFAAGLRFLNPS